MNVGDNNNSRQAAELLLSEELLELCCKSESLSEEGLREKIIEHHELKTNNSHVSDYEFFGWACISERVNEGIIECLLEYFPAAASAISKTGWSPLHRL